MDPEEPLTLYPPWRQAVEDFLAAGFQYGDTVEHEWFWTAFQLEMPRPDTPAATYDRLRLQYVSAFENLRRVLLTEHQIDLRNERAVGYRMVPPGEQTQLACEDGMAEIQKAMNKMSLRVLNVNESMLTHQQKEERAEALTKIVGMRNAIQGTERQKLLE